MNICDPGNFGKVLNAELDITTNESVRDETPQAITPKLIKCLSKHHIKQVACGLNHAVAITKNSGVCYSWGCGGHGQLGRASGT